MPARPARAVAGSSGSNFKRTWTRDVGSEPSCEAQGEAPADAPPRLRKRTPGCYGADVRRSGGRAAAFARGANESLAGPRIDRGSIEAATRNGPRESG
ncbi:unnamed protein product [Lampetra fluviatilis]